MAANPRRRKIATDTLREHGFAANCRQCGHIHASNERKGVWRTVKLAERQSWHQCRLRRAAPPGHKTLKIALGVPSAMEPHLLKSPLLLTKETFLSHQHVRSTVSSATVYRSEKPSPGVCPTSFGFLTTFENGRPRG